jgi:hypothetical protein
MNCHHLQIHIVAHSVCGFLYKASVSCCIYFNSFLRQSFQIVNAAVFVVLSTCLAICVSDLSKAQRSFAKTLIDFKFECIGSEQTDDEIVIGED